jgi:tetratricopeptide (TPR) repeat protein
MASIADLRRAIELGVMSADVYFLLYLCHRNLGDHAAARAALDRGQELDPQDHRLIYARQDSDRAAAR